MARLFDKQAERKAIKLNYEMGFINYQEFVEQMMETMDYEEKKIVDYCLQAVLDSEDVFKWRRELQEKIDSKIAHQGVISAIIGNL